MGGYRSFARSLPNPYDAKRDGSCGNSYSNNDQGLRNLFAGKSSKAAWW